VKRDDRSYHAIAKRRAFGRDRRSVAERA